MHYYLTSLLLVTGPSLGLGSLPYPRPEVDFVLGELGPITGVESRTKQYEAAPHSGRTTYVFRGIPYAHPVVDQMRCIQKILNRRKIFSHQKYINPKCPKKYLVW